MQNLDKDDSGLSHLESVKNENNKEESQLRIDTMNFNDLFLAMFFEIIIIFIIFFVSFLGSKHFSQTSKRFDVIDPRHFEILIPSFELNHYYSLYQISIQAKQNKKISEVEILPFQITASRNYQNNLQESIRADENALLYFKFDGSSFYSEPVNIISSHDTRSSSLYVKLRSFQTSKISNAIDYFIINIKIGESEVMYIINLLKALTFFVSIIIFILFIWLIKTANTYIWQFNFILSLIIWALFEINSIMYGFQTSNYFLFIFNTLSKIAFSAGLKIASILFLFSSVCQDTLTFQNVSGSKYTFYGCILFALLDSISIVISALTVFSFDQIPKANDSAKLEFASNVLFIIYIIFLYYKYYADKVLIIHFQLKSYFYLALMHYIVIVGFQLYTYFGRYVELVQAMNCVLFVNSFIYILVLLCFNWPIDDVSSYQEFDEKQEVLDYEISNT